MNLPRVLRPTGPKRPWLAGLLALVVTGLGHAYLRRWLRGFGWFAATFAAIVLFVPPEVVEALDTGTAIANPTDALPPVFIVVASAVDAYLLARQTQRTPTRVLQTDDDGTPVATGDVGAAAGAGTEEAARNSEAGDGPACPACGKELDTDLDFCPWCTTKLDRVTPNGDDVRSEQ